MLTNRTQFKVNRGQEQQTVTVEQAGPGSFTIRLGGDSVALDVQSVGPREYHALCGDRSLGFLVHGSLPDVTLHHDGETVPIELLDERQEARMAAVGAGQNRGADGTVTIAAPMPGKVVKCLVQEGEEVSSGQGVVVVEAMKMENELAAPRDGVISEVLVKEGQAVEGGAPLVVVADG